MAGVKMVHVPYKGGGAVVVDLMSGQLQTDFRIDHVAPRNTLGQADRPRGHDIEAGCGPAGPADGIGGGIARLRGGSVVRRFRAGAHAAGHRREGLRRLCAGDQLSDVRERIAPQLIEAVGSSPAELAAFLDKELKKWGRS
jgi:hypothetical protein